MRILITAPYHEKALQQLQETFGEVIYKPWKPHGRAYNEQELTALLAQTKAEALITEHDQVTEQVITTYPDLQFIGVCRGTPSNVAVATATALDIPVFNTPARNAQAVAEMFVANVITFLRHTMAGCAWLEGENWEAGAHTSYLQFKGNELAGKTIGMVGFGAIGQRIAEMVRCYPCAIQFYDPYLDSPDPDYRKTTLEELFETSDIVSIHLPVTAQTTHMIDASLIARMKPEAIFVNTARAAVVKREDLLDALENKRIRGAILDVFDHEPPDETDYKIIHMPHVLATPHIAGATFEVEDHHADIMNGALQKWFVEGKKDLRQLVNRSILTLQS
ncbi:2-hydroxyacid dehydrogenase [Pontibacter mangrovi]|uniref:Hydroxyacid dehydrogenase n=1 Tax=Pontibacter mangrovi TaxID=2589816 RepID=A0A501W273_9BACT|nr:2-hydroxyacid dehydrogenase [Pontibacter mangrovi]TPE42380.1 hydroxyacid dehydrogenase [Pontibacter mangrovi]